MSNEKTNVQSERKDYPILEKMKNLPGGLVIIPLVIAVVIATFIPQFFQIGGYVTALFYEGNACMMGFFLIVCGSMIDVKQVGLPLYKGVVMTGVKFLLGVIVGVIVGKLCGPQGFLGIAPFVFIAAITNSNSSLYISLSSQFGNATDTGAVSILALNDGPFFTLIALGATGLANIPINSLIAAAIFLGGTPLQLKMRAAKQVEVNQEYCNPVDYTFSDEGIVAENDGNTKNYKWDEIERAVVTPKTIGIYYGKDNAMIIPKVDFGDQFVPIFTIIATQLGQSKVRMH